MTQLCFYNAVTTTAARCIDSGAWVNPRGPYVLNPIVALCAFTALPARAQMPFRRPGCWLSSAAMMHSQAL